MCTAIKSLLVKQQDHSNVIMHYHVQGHLALFDNLQGIFSITFNIFTSPLKILKRSKISNLHYPQ